MNGIDSISVPVSHSSTSRRTMIIFLVILVLAGIIAFFALHHQPAVAQHQAASAQTADTAQKQTPAETSAPASTTAPTTPQVDFARDVVHKGGGIENPLKLQFIADPSLANGEKYKFTGDLKDPVAVKKWAGHAATVLNTDIGKRDWRFGGEIRVHAPDSVAYHIQKDASGKLQVVEYTVKVPPGPNSKTGEGATFSLAATHNAAPTIAASTFLGVGSDGHPLPLPSYEYLYVGGK